MRGFAGSASATEQEHRCAPPVGSPPGPGSAAPGDRPGRSRWRLVRRRWGGRSSVFTRFDGNLHGLPVPSPAGCVTSATGCRLGQCPYAYFVRRFSGCSRSRARRTSYRSPRSIRGTSFTRSSRGLSRATSSPAGRSTAARRACRRGPGTDWWPSPGRYATVRGTWGVIGRPIFWHRDRRRILIDLVLFLEADTVYRKAEGRRRSRPNWPWAGGGPPSPR